MSKLFTEVELRGLKISNRIVVSPMCQYQAIDGSAGDWHLMNLGQYAMGAAGLVLTEATHVSAEGRITPRCLGLYSDDNEQALKRVVDFCREYGVVKLGTQLAHAGRKASTHTPSDGAVPLQADQGAWQTVSASAIAYGDWHIPQQLDRDGIRKVVDDFVAATRRAERIGLDVIELHGAHGYLLHQFLSPLSNQRSDEYGGSLENRMRLPLEVFEAVRKVWPEQKPLGMRLSAQDWVEGGWSVDETIATAKALADLGCDFIDVTSAGLDPAQEIKTGPGYQVPFAARVRREAGIHTWAVGMITEAAQAEKIIADGDADMVALARGMMRNPRWGWHAAEELDADTAWAPQYVRAHPSRSGQQFATQKIKS